MTNRVNKIAEQLEDALCMVRQEIAKAENGEKTIDSTTQLEQVASSLQEMLDNVKRETMPSRQDRNVGLWRYVIDSWPYQSELRKKVVEAELAYDRL